MTSPAQQRLSRRNVFTGLLAFGGAVALAPAAAGRALAAGPAAASSPDGVGAGSVAVRRLLAGPDIVSCAGWGARPASEQVVVLSTPPQRIIVHHTATQNVSDYSRDRAFALARAVQNHHMGTNGWIDTGQHFTISRGAFVLEGRHQSLAELRAGTRQVRSAHCVGQNNTAIGIENEGTYMTSAPPTAQFDALVALCAHICLQYGLASSEIYGHRDFNSTNCPGDKLYALLPKLRAAVADLTGDERTEPMWHPAARAAHWHEWQEPHAEPEYRTAAARVHRGHHHPNPLDA
ncbi:peptidoglycan recognition family protein [Streptomyces sp. NPDC097619]|uniref:peptidoglycan recognition protein family protein n=1 Tax=Streptomyces sp. NPDC097619 TaxID=3157228 RepID=UPI003318A170